jgi:hypothetical protein
MAVKVVIEGEDGRSQQLMYQRATEIERDGRALVVANGERVLAIVPLARLMFAEVIEKEA